LTPLAEKSLTCKRTFRLCHMKNIAILLILFSVQTAFKSFRGGPGDYAPVIRQQAENMGKALVKRDYKTYIKYTDPRIVQEMGGEVGFADSLKGYEAQWHRFNMSIFDINVDDPSWVIDSAGELQSSIPVITQMRVQGGLVTTVSTFVGLSKDKGKNWVFIDCGQVDYQTLRKSYPDLSSKLKVPPVSKPTFRAD
jgi:hypothetical protein